MSFSDTKKAYLVLADGTVFEGYSMGTVGVTFGEVVFNTCMESYQDIFSDPTYYGQIIAQTYPLVGNRGVEQKSNIVDRRIMASGYIVQEWCDTPTDINAGVTLDQYLKDRNIVGICGINTRRLTRTIRDAGYIKGAITDNIDNLPELLEKIKAYTISGAVEAVTIKESVKVNCDNPKYNVVIIDYGFPQSMLEPFIKRGCEINIVPANTSCSEIMKYEPDGIILSDGPADPDDNPALIDNIKEIIKQNVPVFCLGLGLQMAALAVNGKVEKMLKGHRGSNQPVRISGTDKVMVTTQNHGYSVTKGSIPENIAKVNLTNLNDDTVEGLVFNSFSGIGVQFIPRDGTGYQDNSWIYDDFIEMLGGNHR